jgi:hypothetical protein
MIKLPDERAEQLRILSKNRNLPIADLIAEYVNEQIEKGHLAPDLPMIEVRRTGAAIVLDFGTFKRELTLELAQAYATALDWFATRTGALPLAAQAASGAHLVGIKRQGTSIKVFGENDAERALAPSIARDLARIIRNACA